MPLSLEAFVFQNIETLEEEIQNRLENSNQVVYSNDTGVSSNNSSRRGSADSIPPLTGTFGIIQDSDSSTSQAIVSDHSEEDVNIMN